MSISIESGKRAPFSFENSKIKVEGSKGIFYDGQIRISSDNKIVPNGTKESPNSNQNEPKSMSSQSLTSEASNKVKASLESRSIKSSMAKSLKSGQKLGLEDINLRDNKMVLGFGLDYLENRFEVDFSAFLIDESGKSSEDNFIFYGKKSSDDRAIILDDDLSLKVSDCFDGVMSIDFNKLDTSIKRISLTATIYDDSIKFGNLKNGRVSLINTSKEELLNYDFTSKLSSENAIVICDFYLHNGKWKLQGIGQGFNGGLSALCSNFGVETI